MNNKLLLQDLTDQLSDMGKLKKKDAEEFLRTFFKVIEEALFDGEVVKISGLGTFKLIQVDSRKSVNVSTGKEFEIKEHYKVSFTPDSGLKEVVNAPFSHLEPVELDGIKTNREKPFEMEIVERDVYENEARGKGTLSERNIAEENDLVIEKGRSYAPRERVQEPTSQNRYRPETPNERYRSETSNERVKEDGRIPVQEKKRVPIKSNQKSEANQSRPYLIVFIILLLSLGIWAFISNRNAVRDNEKKLKEIPLVDTTAYNDALPEEFETNLDDSARLEAEIASQLDSLAKVKKPVKSKPIQIKQAPTNKKEEAYSAVSTEKLPVTLTLEQGDRLTLMALKYYGHKAFWVYIYAANKNSIPDPNNIPIGTKIRIPKSDPSRTNANDPNCIAKAKALQTKILSME